MRLQWSDDLSVGVDELDRDHRLVMHIAGAVRQAFDQRHQGLALAGCETMVESCRGHFRREAEMLAACRYPDREDHHTSHAVLLEMLDQMRFDVDRGLWLPAQACLGQVVTMLSEHLTGEDAAYGHWLAEQKLVPIYADLDFAGWAKE